MVNWYPGHMVRAKKVFENNIKFIDLVIEVLDARIPESSRTNEINKVLKNKEHIIILNKQDLADDAVTRKWMKHYEYKEKVKTLAVNALKSSNIINVKKKINSISKELNKKMRDRGRKPRSIRVMVVGIPNVGKSALINSLAGSGIARTGDKPGVTRGKQWIKIANKIELLDTPGILSPELENEEKAYKLAITGAIKKTNYDQEIAACRFIDYTRNINKQIIEDHYNIKINEEHSYDVLRLIGKKRGCLMSGGKVDRERAAGIILADYQRGNIGAVSLEVPINEGI